MEGVQGAILRVKLRYLEDWTEARRQHAAYYTELLADSTVKMPVERPDVRHVYHVYAVRTPERDRLQETLQTQGIQTGFIIRFQRICNTLMQTWVIERENCQ